MRKNVQAIADAFMSGSARTESRMFRAAEILAAVPETKGGTSSP
jgi:hypothetical protein